MHLQQTKQASAKSGGPQYYFHNLENHVRIYLRTQGFVSVALVTPYGATKSDFFAVGKDHKLNQKTNGVFVAEPGSVGHDRIQMGHAGESIGEAIRRWFNLKAGQFERIDIKIDTVDDIFYLTPTRIKYSNQKNARPITVSHRPLTFERDYMSPLWKEQIKNIKKEELIWSFSEIARIVRDHHPKPVPHIQEQDLLRASGPLQKLGVSLGPYVGKGYDCMSTFQFLKFQRYSAPVEIKKQSANFSYQEKKYGKAELSRAVILCTDHNHTQLPENIDVIELVAFLDYAQKHLGLSLQ